MVESGRQKFGAFYALRSIYALFCIFNGVVSCLFASVDALTVEPCLFWPAGSHKRAACRPRRPGIAQFGMCAGASGGLPSPPVAVAGRLMTAISLDASRQTAALLAHALQANLHAF